MLRNCYYEDVDRGAGAIANHWEEENSLLGYGGTRSIIETTEGLSYGNVNGKIFTK